VPRLLDSFRQQRDEIRAQLDALFDIVAERGDDLNDTEEANATSLRERMTALDARIEQLSELELRNAQSAELAARVDGASGHRPASVRVGSEPTTYNERSQHSFFADTVKADFNHDRHAAERLERHHREAEALQERAVGTEGLTGNIVPQYLVELFAPLARAGRITADLVRHLPLPPSGTMVSVPRVLIGSEVASQVTENGPVASRDLFTDMVTAPLVTVAGKQVISRQALERGQMIDSLIYQDLVSAYYQELNRQVIDGRGTDGEHLGILHVANTIEVEFNNADPDSGDFYRVFADAIQRINTERLMPATAAVVAPRRWGWLTSQTDEVGRPLVVPRAQGPMNAQGVGQSAALGLVGEMQGLAIFSDPSVPTDDGLATPTDEDPVAVVRAEDLLLFEEGDGSPRQLRLETCADPLSVGLVAYGYSAFIAGRTPKSIAKITGTGLSAPTFG
jgi:HK97 family phage major capsid protein